MVENRVHSIKVLVIFILYYTILYDVCINNYIIIVVVFSDDEHMLFIVIQLIFKVEENRLFFINKMNYIF